VFRLRVNSCFVGFVCHEVLTAVVKRSSTFWDINLHILFGLHVLSVANFPRIYVLKLQEKIHVFK
jgi:hypothetical protein